MVPNPIAKFYSETEVRAYIDRLINEHELCPKHCSIERVKSGACFSYHIKKCKGVCCGKEDIAIYNKRVQNAIDSVQYQFEDKMIVLKGREPLEKGIVFIKDGHYMGYAFTKKRKLSFDHCEPELVKQVDNSDVKRILGFYKRNFDDWESVV